MSRQDHQASDREAYFGSRAARQIQKPERHPDEREVHQENPFRAPVLAIVPARHGIPKKENPANKARAPEHVLARRRTRKLRHARPRVVKLADSWKILDQ